MKPVSLFVTVICIMALLSFYSFTPGKSTGMVEDVFIETNVFRKANGKSKLLLHKELNNIARQHSENMASGRVRFGHAGFEKRNVLANKTIPALSYFAENVAYGAATGKEAVTMWMRSPGHRNNMLGSFTYLGIGIATDKQGNIYYTQVFAD